MVYILSMLWIWNSTLACRSCECQGAGDPAYVGAHGGGRWLLQVGFGTLHPCVWKPPMGARVLASPGHSYKPVPSLLWDGALAAVVGRGCHAQMPLEPEDSSLLSPAPSRTQASGTSSPGPSPRIRTFTTCEWGLVGVVGAKGGVGGIGTPVRA